MFMLDKLWRGEITPSEKYIRRGSEYEVLLQRISGLEDSIRRELSEEGQRKFETYLDLRDDLQSIEDRETFFSAFRMGAGMILDVVTDRHGDLESAAEQ